ncbi:hypothetical protein B0H14DRAFT_3461904 [Mycena olivaceomarginata]|nr:hypothetical protein B0H14DRAFT_3461904 [Mycena olivaceomarginata]
MGDDVSTAPKASGHATPAQATTTVSTHRAYPFERTIQALIDRGTPKAAATHQKFAAVSSNGQPVSSVLTHLRLPPHQTLLGVPDIMADECVVAAMAATEKDIAMVFQVEKVLELVDIPRSADVLAVALHGYCIRIITSAGDPDTQAWHPCVSAIKSHKEAKANAVITACADAEMVDANRPIEEIVSEKVYVAITAFKETLEKKKKKKCPAPTEPPEPSRSNQPLQRRRGRAHTTSPTATAEEKQKRQAKGNGKAKAKPVEAETVDESDNEST